MSQSLIAFDTDHIKRYVFGTSKLKEIRGASSILDDLNRVETVEEARKFHAQKIFAHGGSALFLIDAEDSEKKAEQLGRAVQKRYWQKTGGGASITFAIQPIPPNHVNIVEAEQVTEDVSIQQLLQLLRLRLRLAKDGQQTSGSQLAAQRADPIAQPTHPFLCMCKSCGVAYAETLTNDPDEQDARYCRICNKKRKEDEDIKDNIKEVIKNEIPQMLSADLSVAEKNADENEEGKLWERILRIMSKQNASGAPPFHFPEEIERPQDFQAFRNLGSGRGYLGLIYADANSMGKALEEQTTLTGVMAFAKRIDKAVFEAMGEAIKEHLPAHHGQFPFDILMIGGDDIVMVTPADKALEVAWTLAKRFTEFAEPYTLSVGVVLVPVAYPFHLQLKLAEDILKDAKKAGAVSKMEKEETVAQKGHISFVVVTGNTSLSYKKIRNEMQFKNKQEEFHATLRPYTLSGFEHLLDQLRKGKRLGMGRTKLHQLREAILRLNRTTTILESLALFRNWRDKERSFIREMVEKLDPLTEQEQKQRGTLFPWYLASKKDTNKKDIYCTPLLDFIELYDFVSSQERDS